MLGNFGNDSKASEDLPPSPCGGELLSLAKRDKIDEGKANTA